MGAAGAIVSSVIATVRAALSLPSESLEVIAKAFAPSARETAACHVVAEFTDIFSVPFINIEVSMSFVPERVCVVMFVGVVTGFTVGALGACVSKSIVTFAGGLSLSSGSLDVTVKVLFPSWRVSSTCHVVWVLRGISSAPFMYIELLASFVPDRV